MFLLHIPLVCLKYILVLDQYRDSCFSLQTKVYNQKGQVFVFLSSETLKCHNNDNCENNYVTLCLCLLCWFFTFLITLLVTIACNVPNETYKQGGLFFFFFLFLSSISFRLLCSRSYRSLGELWLFVIFLPHKSSQYIKIPPQFRMLW